MYFINLLVEISEEYLSKLLGYHDYILANNTEVGTTD